MKIRSILLLLTVVILSCAETQIENDARVLIEGRVVDQANNPLANAYIEVFTNAGTSFSQNVKLGEGFSDALGVIQVTSLFGSNDNFNILITHEDPYATYQYQTNTRSYTPTDFVIQLGTLELTQIANFSYTITRTSGLDNTLDFSFRFIEPNCLERYEQGVLVESATNCYELRQISGQLNNVVPNVENANFNVPLSSVVEFTYSLNGNTPVNQLIDINSSPYAFEFTY